MRTLGGRCASAQLQLFRGKVAVGRRAKIKHQAQPLQRSKGPTTKPLPAIVTALRTASRRAAPVWPAIPRMGSHRPTVQPTRRARGPPRWAATAQQASGSQSRDRRLFDAFRLICALDSAAVRLWSALFYLLCSCLCFSSGCTTVSFLSQAAAGQWNLGTSGRPLTEVITDYSTPPETRRLLQEVIRIKKYGAGFGLQMHENYEEFVQLEAPFVVWFVNASAPLAFEPKTFWFPIVGTFPGLSWFDEQDARQFASELEAEGWDVNLRGVTAFSTGGWFDDPIVSSMFFDHPAALGFLVNTVLHESVHATVLAPDQQYFNESLASFVANEMTPKYLTERFGPYSIELTEYLAAMERGQVNFELMSAANTALTNLYMSPLSDEEKYRQKKKILDDLTSKVPFETPPNNATLIGVQLYNEGKVEMEELRATCGTWERFLAAVDSLRPRDFGMEQSPFIGPALKGLTVRGCVPHPPPKKRIYQKQWRQRTHRMAHRESP